MVSLQVANTRGAYKGGGLGALDSFGDGRKTEVFDEFDQMAQNDPLPAIRREV